MEDKIFDLDNIKQYFYPIEEIQSKISYINSILIKNNSLNQSIENYVENEELKINIKQNASNINDLSLKLINIINNNLKKYIIFEDNLIKKYKDVYLNKIKLLNADQNFLKKIGLFLIDTKQISKVIQETSYIPSITYNNWSDLLDSLKNNSSFIAIIDKIDKFYNKIIKEKLKEIISKIPNDISPIIIADFKKEFLKNPNISFNDFVKNIENKLTEKEFIERKEIIEESREKQKIEELKKTQEEQKKSYEDYFKYSDKEFERRRRKKKREKLSEISEKAIKNDTINEEITEKIKQFKSKFGNSFEEKYLIQKDDNKDPLNIIRERKKKKEEEYKKFLNKLKE
ncbi:MAG: hypothetical protein JXA99_01525 [Candidatus Lokiarchaeota archaeon]|nr:hypothetical protein [Candidatus Lokiarchaeota archaeon]